MLSSAFADMETCTFRRLPNLTNAVESYNQLCKGATPDVLNVAKFDMTAAIQHLAVTNGMSVAYEQQTPEARRATVVPKTVSESKRRWNEADDAQGPPDRRSDYGELLV